MATALVATWTSNRECIGEVTYGAGGEASQTTDPEPRPTRSHRRLLLNLPANVDVSVRVGCAEAHEAPTTESAIGTTGTLPPGLADLTLDGTPEAGTDLLFVPTLGADTAATILDLQGRVVRYHVEGQGMGVTRERPSADGTSLL